VTVEVSGGEVLMNPVKAALGNLAGRNERLYPWSPWGQQWSANAKPTEWLVRAAAGTALTVTAISEKGGTQRRTITLGASA